MGAAGMGGSCRYIQGVRAATYPGVGTATYLGTRTETYQEDYKNII